MQSVIDSAQKVLDDVKSDAKAYNDQKTTLDNAMKTVNDSKAAKEQADAEAAAAAQAEASTSQSSGGSYGYTGGGNGYSNYGYNNGGYTGWRKHRQVTAAFPLAPHTRPTIRKAHTNSGWI